MALLLGYFSRRTPAKIVNICLGAFVTVYGILMFIIQPEIHYLHYMAMLFVFFISLALLLSRSSPATKPEFRTMTVEGLDLRPWKHFKLVSVMAMLVMIGAYISFSSWGLVESDKPKTIEYGYIAMGLVIAFCVFGIPLFRKRVSSAG